VGFILVIIELFLLGVTAEALQENNDWQSAFLKERGQFGPKFYVQGVVPHQPFSCRKSGMTDFLYGIRLSAEVFLILSQFTRLTDRQTDRQTDGRTDGRLYDRQHSPCIVSSEVKNSSVWRKPKWTSCLVLTTVNRQ